NFRVVRATMPKSVLLPSDEAVAISCGRGEIEAGHDEKERQRGEPLFSRVGAAILARNDPEPQWESDWVVRWTNVRQAYGIVAREFMSDERTPEAVRNAFRDFLDVARGHGLRRVHVQLLAAGDDRSFEPWVSLVQMARAYGEWFRESG